LTSTISTAAFSKQSRFGRNPDRGVLPAPAVPIRQYLLDTRCVNFKLAILTVLAKWPDRRATVDEVRREVGLIIANEDQAEQLRRLSALGDFDDAGLSGFVTTTGGSCDWDGPEGRPNNVAAAYSPRYA
jgi:hypothetical protein